MLRLLFLVMLFCFLGCSNQSRQKTDSTQIQVASADSLWDFSRVKEGQILKHGFILRNNSEKTLHINNVNTSCGCTVFKIDKKVLLSQESATIEVKFDSKGYSGPTIQFVYVNTDSLDSQIIKFIIKAEVYR